MTLFPGPPAFSLSLIGLTLITTLTVSLSFGPIPEIAAIEARMLAAPGFLREDLWAGLVGVTSDIARGCFIGLLIRIKAAAVPAAALWTSPLLDKKLLSTSKLRS